MVCFMHVQTCTMEKSWIFNFTQILRETNFGKLRATKTGILTISKVTIENYGKSKQFLYTANQQNQNSQSL